MDSLQEAKTVLWSGFSADRKRVTGVFPEDMERHSGGVMERFPWLQTGVFSDFQGNSWRSDFKIKRKRNIV
jgi:hypothetical protein